jgi:hypothetical protein
MEIIIVLPSWKGGSMESNMTKEELCAVYLDIMALEILAAFICENAEETVDKDFFRIYERTLNAVTTKIEEHLD